MTIQWLHIAKIPGLDGNPAWLVVPSVDDRIFRASMGMTPAPEPMRYLPTFGGWLVPLASEAVLWAVVHHACGDAAVCRHCLYSDSPCEAWMHVVEQRFEEANQERLRQLAYVGTQQLVYLPQPQSLAPQFPQQAPPAQPSWGQPSWGQPSQQQRQDWERQSRQVYDDEPRSRPRRPAYRDNSPPPYTPPPRRPPAPPPPTREERLAAAAQTLGITWPASREQVKKAFRASALRSHPDTGGTNEGMKAVIEARDILLRAA